MIVMCSKKLNKFFMFASRNKQVRKTYQALFIYLDLLGNTWINEVKYIENIR